jgi:hypothetical protein
LTANGLRRRLDVLEESAIRSLVQRVANETGLNAVELRAEYDRLKAEEHRLRRLWLSEEAIRQGLVAWVAADRGVDAAELEAEWQQPRHGEA